MDDETLEVVYTCGICETIVSDYNLHSCMEGYKNIFLDNNNYFYPVLDDGETIVRRSAFEDGTEQVVCEHASNNKFSEPPAKKMKRSQPKQQNQQKKLNDDEVEILLMAVEDRIPLWNFELPIEERSREKIATLWQEVSAELNDVISAETAKTKFKSLRDTYRKIVRGEHRASGSARVTPKDNWKFYQRCEFLRDSCLIKNTSSNVESSSTNQLDEDDSYQINADDFTGDTDTTVEDNISHLNHSTPVSTRFRRSKNKANESQGSLTTQAINRLVDVMSKENPSSVSPEKPTMDLVDHLLSGAAEQIRKFPANYHFDACMQVLKLVQEYGQKFSAEN